MKEKEERFKKELTLCDLEKTERLSIKDSTKGLLFSKPQVGAQLLLMQNSRKLAFPG